MTEKQFVDIEIGADIGQIRLYTTDEDYETYGSEDILNLLNEQHETIEQLQLDNKRLLSDYTDVCNENVALEEENEQLKQQLIEKERMLDVRDKIITDVMKAVNGDFE